MSRDARSHSWIFDRKRLYLHSHSAPAPAHLPGARLSLVRSDGATLGLNHEPRVWGGWGFHHAKQRIPAGPELPSRLPNAPQQKPKTKQKMTCLFSWNRQAVIYGLSAAWFSESSERHQTGLNPSDDLLLWQMAAFHLQKLLELTAACMKYSWQILVTNSVAAVINFFRRLQWGQEEHSKGSYWIFFFIIMCLNDVLKYNEGINCRSVRDFMQSIEERERDTHTRKLIWCQCKVGVFRRRKQSIYV